MVFIFCPAEKFMHVFRVKLKFNVWQNALEDKLFANKSF